MGNLSTFEELLPFLTLLAGALLTVIGFLAKRLLDTYGTADLELDRHLERIETKVDENTRALGFLAQRVAAIETVMGLPTNRMAHPRGSHRRAPDEEWERWTHHRTDDDPPNPDPPR